ncbi:hypothetical protein FOZ62_020848 [Perkinsus olseni]|uniref:Uncharacterized protein n=1 Tax=Perkinsus olseni TaxID=32597 RepID=A0A7J6TSF6_PEROL|nr:hypothetical protein FOZ62_020848 [Perkinsus olseni]
MLPVCGGAILCGHGEVNFVLLGALFAIGSVFFRALKNTMQGAMVVHSLKTPGMLVTSWALFGNPVKQSQILGFVIITAGVYYYRTNGAELTSGPELPRNVDDEKLDDGSLDDGQETYEGDDSSGCTDLEMGELRSDAGLE